MAQFGIIFASTINGGIGYNNTIPWNYSEDLKWFKEITIGNGKNAIVMGRKTYESLGSKFPLKGRENFVISKQSLPIKNVFSSPQEAFFQLRNSDFEIVYVIGGAEIYHEFLRMNILDIGYWTLVKEQYECDTFIDLSFVKSAFRSIEVIKSTDYLTFYKLEK